MRRRMQVVFQDPFASLSPRMTVERDRRRRPGAARAELSTERERERVVRDAGRSRAHAKRSSPALLGRYPHEFSGGQRQRLAIARA